MSSAYTPTTTLRLHISLRESPRPVRRRVVVSQALTLEGLHRVIQLLTQGWDYHLYFFTIRGEIFGDPDPEYDFEVRVAEAVRLADLRLKKGEVFVYEYDFGDSWEWEIRVEGREQGERGRWTPWLLDGEGAGPPEDCGGLSGFAHLLEALRDPEHEEHDDLRRWVGEDYDPDAFDLRAHRHALLLAGAWGALPAVE